MLRTGIIILERHLAISFKFYELSAPTSFLLLNFKRASRTRDIVCVIEIAVAYTDELPRLSPNNFLHSIPLLANAPGNRLSMERSGIASPRSPGCYLVFGIVISAANPNSSFLDNPETTLKRLFR